MYEKKRVKIVIEVIVYILFTWFSLYLYSNLNLSLVNIFDLNLYMDFFREKILTMFLLLFSLGVSTSILFIAVRQLSIKAALLTSLFSSALAFLPALFFVNTENIFYLFIAIFYILGITFITFTSHKKIEKNVFEAFDIGWHSVRKAFYIVAIGAFFGSLLFVNLNSSSFEESFKDLVSSSVKSKETVMISKDQIRGMLEQKTADLQMSREEVKAIVSLTMPELSPDAIIAMNYPDFESYTAEQKQLIHEQVSSYLSSEQYKDNLEQSIDQQTEIMYARLQDPQYISESNSGINEETVDKIYEQMNDDNFREKLADDARSVIDSMPIMQKMFRFMPVIVAVTIFTIFLFAELVSSFTAGFIFMLHYAIYKKVIKNAEEDDFESHDIEGFVKDL